jgi:hypothetical protein
MGVKARREKFTVLAGRPCDVMAPTTREANHGVATWGSLDGLFREDDG